MKRVLFVLGFLVLIFMGLSYWSLSSTDKSFMTCEIKNSVDSDTIDFKKYDSVLVAASTLYKPNGIKNLMQGAQYRSAWATPVNVPILFLDTLMGNVSIVEEGGGQQTHSLKLKTNDGTLLTLRSVTKDPSPLIPKLAETLGLENIVVDGISAQHPYAALVVAELSKKAGIFSTAPRLVFVPKQEKLQKFNDKFGNRLFLLEYETEGNATWMGVKNVTSLLDTEDLQEIKLKNPKTVHIDVNALVRARLFDLLIGDWDRHAKQWGWAIQDNGEYKTALPLPCDRDNAFFNLEGVLPTLISNNAFLPEVQAFEREVDYVPGLVSSFDVYFMRDIPEVVFMEEAMNLQRLLTDETILHAFSVWPKSVFDLDGEEIIEKIKARRKDLLSYAFKFKKAVHESDTLAEPLNGSEDLELTTAQMACFNCMVNSE